MITRFLRLGIAVGVAAGMLLSAAAKEIVVPSSYDEATDTWVGDVVALTNALKNLAQNDVITLSKGVYSIAFMTNSPMYGTSADSGYGFALLSVNKKNVTIRGESGDPEDVVIDATGSDCRAIMNSSTGTKFLDLTVKGGSAGSKCAPYNQRRGGGLMFASSGVVSNCFFTANYAARGGGAISPQNNVTSGTVVDSLFYGNSVGANCGGAIRNCSLVSGCTIISNKAFTADSHSHGGGGVAHCTTVTNCTIAYNYAKGSGGGLYQCKKVFDSTVAHNVAEEYVQYESGGAGGAYGGRFYNCTFKDNYAGSISEGAYMEGCVIEDGGIDCLTNINCVIRNLHNSNTHVWAKGNVQYPDGKSVGTRYAVAHVDLIRNCVITNCVWAYDNGSKPNCAFFRTVRRMENCTIADNDYAYFGYGLGTVFNTAIIGNWSSWKKAAGDVSMYESASFVFSNCVWNVLGTRTNSERAEPYVDGNCIVLGENVKPKFLNKGEHPLTPKLNSPLVGAGMVMPWMSDAVDFAGNPRIRDGKVDIGAYQCWMTPLGLGLIFR